MRYPSTRSQWTLAKPPAEERLHPAYIQEKRWPVARYRALPTLRPRAWTATYGTSTFGNAVTLSTTGADAIGRHSFLAKVIIETEDPDFQGSLEYAYNELPFALRASLFRSVKPRNDYQLGLYKQTIKNTAPA